MLWIMLFIGLYPYVVYPILVWALARVIDRAPIADTQMRTVTVVIAAYNEADCIEATVRNKLDQEYPADLLNVIVVSDASDDGTDGIVETISRETGRVTLIRQEPRNGKTAALNRAVAISEAEIVVFSDANSLYEPDAIRSLLSLFGDTTVGYVSGRMVYTIEGELAFGDGCSAYMRYENWLREQETRVGSIVGVDGGVDAVRRELYQPMRADHLPDFVLPLQVVRQGSRVVYQPNAVLSEDALMNNADEFRMRVRVTTRAVRALRENLALLNPVRHGLFSWQLLSHKWLRYLSFLPLSIAFLLSITHYDGSLANNSMLIAEFAFVTFVIVGYAWPKMSQKFALVRWSKFFALVNFASAIGISKALRGHRYVTWRPRRG